MHATPATVAHPWTAAIAVCALLTPGAAGQQDAPPPVSAQGPTAAELLQRWRRLPAELRQQVVRNLERRLVRESDPTLQRVVSSQRGDAAYSPAPPRRWFEPREFAPNAPPRTLVAKGTPAHRTATAGMRALTGLEQLHAHVTYDWLSGTAVRSAAELDDEERFANLVHGFAPNADHAVARVLAVLDNDADQRRLAAYFDHLYADRAGRVFEGVTLFEAWDRAADVEMPDVDAIAFARTILGSRSFASPIPADKRRDRLYGQVRDAFVRHREYRTLRLALAATFVTASPPVDPAYEGLLMRCHWLWQHHGEDPRQLAAHLAAAGDRTRLLDDVDRELSKDDRTARARRTDLAGLVDWLRALAAHELEQAGG
jgi:hypothetical protein